MEVNVCDIKITNPDKILYQKGKIKKLDVVNYYENIAGKMLPFISDRLLSVIRCHQGCEGEKFFKKHPTTDKQYVEVFEDGEDEFFYVKDKKELVYQAQMGTIEFHTWGSSVPEINKPNMMIFDLDPSEDVSLKKLRQGVIELEYVLSDLGLESYLKTSGGKGYHIAVPITKFDDWQAFNKFSKDVAVYMESKLPTLFTSNIRKSVRKGKIFVDYLRNSKGSTCAAPYSLRARENAPVSFPISWDNLNEIKPNEINIKNYQQYLELADSWNDIATFEEKFM